MRSLTTAVLLTTALIFPSSSHAQQKKKLIPAGSTLYVDTNNGFDIFILAAFTAKDVPIKLVATKDQADFILDSTVFHDTEFIAGAKAAGTYKVSEAAFKLTNKAGDIIWAYAAMKGLGTKGGKQSVSESCAKHIKDLCERPRK